MTAAEAGVVGSGRVGLSLAVALRDSGAFDPVWVAGRGAEVPEFLRGRDGVEYGVRGGWLRRLPDRPADELLLFFCVPDRSIDGAARSWGRGLAEAGLLPGGGERADGPRLRAAFHTSGSRPASELAPLVEPAGSEAPPVASLHPLRAVARPTAGAFRDVAFGVEGEPGAVEIAVEVAEAIGRRAVRVSPGEKARYHAGAVFASNLLAACLGAGLRQLEEATEGQAGLEDVLPLARSAVEQVAGQGLDRGLTGPVVRGDTDTVRRHLEALDPADRSLYASLTTELLRQAEVAPAVRRAVEELFDTSLSSAPGAGRGVRPGRRREPRD